MTEEDLSARLFVRLYTSLLDDEDMVELSYAAIGVYAVGLLLSKHTATDGRIPLKLFRRDAALRPGTPIEEALDELASAGLVTIDDGDVTVRSWAKYNALTADILARRAARKESGRRASHERWHDGPFEQCARCNPDVSPDQCESHAPASDPDAGRNTKSESESESKSKSKSKSKSEPTTTADSSRETPAPDLAAVVAIADGLLQRIGYVGDAARATDDLIGYVQALLERGWPAENLELLATEIGAMPDHEIEKTPKHVLLGGLRLRLNTDPPVNPSPSPGAQPASARPGSWNESTTDRLARLGLATEETAQ